MRKFLWLLICVGSVWALSAEGVEAPGGKNYCLPEQIILMSNQILVQFEGEVIEIDGLLSDQGGIYFEDSMKRCVKCRRALNPKNTCNYACGETPSNSR